MNTKLLSRGAALSAGCLRGLAIIALSSFYFSAFSQEKLIKDLNRTEYKFYNEYSNLVDGNGALYFVSQGKELWKTYGSSPVRLKTMKSISNLVWSELGSMLYFIGEDGGGKEVWRSDGTAAGTIRLRDIRPGSAGSDPRELTDVYGTVFFVADNGGSGSELWKTNGTPAGTVLVRDIHGGPASSAPRYLCNMNGILMFNASNGTRGRDLWKSDGTEAGTVSVFAGAPQEHNMDPQVITSDLNGWIYYTAWQSTTGRELWKSNGTVAGTSRVKDIRRGNVDADITSIVFGGTHLYFNANDGINGQALWKTNGTPTGTVMVKDLSEDTGGDGWIMKMARLGGKLYFISETWGDFEIYKSDGTTEGTTLVTRTDDYQDPEFTYHNGFVFYNTSFFDEETYAFYLDINRVSWESPAPSRVHRYEIPFSYEERDYYDFIPEMIAFNNGIAFSGRRAETEGFKLLHSTGAPGNVSIMLDIYKPTNSSDPRWFVKANGYTFFATIGKWGYHTTLWRTDGTSAGTVMMKEFDGQITNLVASGSHAFVTLEGPYYGNFQLWKSNGTTSGTVKVKEFTDEPGGQAEGSIVPSSDGGVFFYTPSQKLFKSNGTSAGTILVKQFNLITQLAPSGNRAFVIERSTAGGQELWKSNGSVSGTVKVKTIRTRAGADIQRHFRYASNENVYYFLGNDGIHGFELWKTDGTNAGTYMVRDIVQGDEDQAYSDIGRMALLGDRLFFNARWASWEGSPYDLYITDGTDAGTSIIGAEKMIDNFIPLDDRMIFSHRTDYSDPLQIWVSDGTSEGTDHVRTLDVTGENWSSTRINNFIYFTNNTQSIWRTDGTVCATGEFDLNVTEVHPITSIGTKLIFGAYQRLYGKELYQFETGGHDPDPCGPSLSAMSAGEIVLTSGDEELFSSAPNPFASTFTLRVNNANSLPAQVAVYTMTGMPVEQAEVTTNVSHSMGELWSRGLYILKVTVEGKTSVQKIIKE